LLGGATVMIVDGLTKGLFNTSNGMGHYSISSLQQDSFPVSVSAFGHATVSSAIVLTNNVTADFVLVKTGNGMADLRFTDDLTSFPAEVGLLAFRGKGTNVGDGCAGGISGATDFYGPGPLVDVPWTAPSSLIVRPNETFDYTACCVTPQIFARGWLTRFSFGTVPCP
jgi:hypothetical protein